MNLVIIAAFIAVCGAAKLDLTYLPPPSAKTAGGSPGSLQAPRNSFNNGLGGLPKGSYENEFQGVVVDAAAAGTRAAEAAETGLGAPRVSYGSTDSKVGAAAFKTRPSAYQAPQQDESAQGFQEAQGSFSNNAAFQSPQGFQSQGFDNQNAEPQQGFSNSERPRASLDRQATILRYENEVGPENYHYAFETDNGITAEENGVATNGVQAQGGFSYIGDDGQVYSISYTADEGGYQPKGDHLPTPPPIPEEILRSLEQNARDEAAGLIDDGSYDAQKYNAGSDYTESENGNGKYTDQSSKFGVQADADSSGASIDRNQANRRPIGTQNGFKQQANNGQVSDTFTSQDELDSESNVNQQGFNSQSQTSNAFSGQFGQNSDSKLSDETSSSNQFEQISSAPQDQTNNFGASAGSSVYSGSNRGQSRPTGNRNEYLPPKGPNRKSQNGRPQNRPQKYRPTQSPIAQLSQEPSNDEGTPENLVPLGQQDLQSESRPQQAVTSFGQPVSNANKYSSQNGFSSTGQRKPTNGRRPLNGNNFAQRPSSQSFNAFKPSEYLPPKQGNQNRKPVERPQENSQFSQQYNSDSQPDIPEETQDQSLTSLSGSPSFEARPQQTNAYQRPQPARPTQNGNKFPSQSSFGFNSQKATAQPATELTTPLETSNDEENQSIESTLNKRPTNGRPTQPTFTAQYNNNAQNSFASQSRPRPFGQALSTGFPTQASVNQLDQNFQYGNRPSQQNVGAQYSSSTRRPTYAQQSQGPDDSYIYNQPSRPFSTPQGSRFPTAPSSQFDRVTQQSTFAESQFSNSPQDIPSIAPSKSPQSSTRYPKPPSIAPSVSTSSPLNQFGNKSPGSTKYPRPPTLAPMSLTSSVQSQYQNNINGVTQAAISPFPSQALSQTSQFNLQNQFESRPNNQQTQFGQASKPSPFGQQPTQSSLNAQTSSFSQKPSTTFQSQEQKIEQQQDETDIDYEPSVTSQQYNGEIYEYNKPAQTLPPPDSTPVSPPEKEGQVQFGQPRPQFGQTSDEDDQRPSSQFGGSRPQFGAQSRPQAPNNFGAPSKQPVEDEKPYGALAQSMFGSQTSQQSSGSQFGQSRPQYNQKPVFTQNDYESQDTKEPLSETPDLENEPSDAEIAEPQGPKNQFGLVPACCKDNFNQQRKPSQNQFADNQFGQNFGGARKPTNNFAGQGEIFGGPRQPPRFDDETGYHY